MKSTNKKWFTLVELIIVITILAVLATISLISFQNYTRDSRNSKRFSDLNSISKSIEVKLAEWVNIMRFVSGSEARLSSIYLAWQRPIAWTNYEAWYINFSVLENANQDSFKDPLTWSDYKIWVTSLVWGVYQLASIKETEWSTKKAYVIWTFKPRKETTYASGSSTSSWRILTLTNGIGLFRVWDIITDASATWKVLSISSDSAILRIEPWVWMLSGSQIRINANETAWLIRAESNSETPVVNGSSTTLPY